MIRKPKIATLYLLASFLCLFSCQEIVDFSYSHYLQEGSSGTINSRKIQNIHPSPTTFAKYDFPGACSILSKLDTSDVDSIGQLEETDLDTYLSKLKDEFVQILKISQQIKHTKKKIKQLGEISQFSTKSGAISAQQIELLQKFQARLEQINQQIQNNTRQLDGYMNEVMSGSENNQFTEANINFEIQSLKIKLAQLNQLKLGHEPSKGSDFQTYFEGLKAKFNEEVTLIQDLDSILKNYNDLAEKQAEFENKNSRIQAHELLIKDKENCRLQIQKIRQKQRDDVKIKELMSKLRQMKRQGKNISNKYCEGVAKKLEQQVKKLLKVYNFDFQCAQGYDELKGLIDKDLKELERLRKQLDDLRSQTGMDKYQGKFDRNRKFMETKINQISTFKLQQYQHNPQEIQILIQKTQQDLLNSENTKQQIVEKKGKVVAFDHKKTEQYVNRIKKLKGNYCRERELYDKKVKEIKMKVLKFKQDTNYSIKMQSFYHDQLNNLRNLEIQFQALRKRILEKMN